MCFGSKCIFLVVILSYVSGSEIDFKKLSSAFMGDILSQLPARLQCVGTGKNFTNFMYYSRVHPDKHRPLVPGDQELLYSSDYDSTLPTKVIVHGFLDSIHVTDWMQKMKTKFLVTGDYNVIIVDWSCGNEFPYSQAIQNSKITADQLTKLVKFIQDETDAKPDDFHLIGHSMGGHIAALVGHAVPHLGRISALDPAGPRFYSAPLEERLDPGDAKFVDAIHTDSGSGLFEGLGMRAQVGHVDFYPNGGKDQPGCHSSPFDILPRIGWQRAARYYTTCDHLRAVEYYTDSIRSPIQPRRSGSVCQHIAVACRDWETYSQGRCADCSHDGDCALMGYNSDLFWNPEVNKHEYFVKTSEEEPFCLFQYQVIVETECEHGSCHDPSAAAVNPGVMRLELKTRTGRMARLDDKDEKEMKPGGQYVYLATSRFPLGGVQAAKVWFGSVFRRTDSLALPRTQSNSLNLKKIEIVPIEIPDKVNNLSSQQQEPEITVLCGSSTDKTISRNKQLELTINNC
ncbi:pancreatic triacylglycerol lipase isoform X2 [Parasteatoda tepidariorum]|uniref:pancreatic triacylglycerol lipase isoform X2 n=1 Tax=Parasteatoda tepidariorum TaxID=114398 RepID=UPI001C725BF1|nr:pancreatic triacylglycerol lipase isoform X2 [Parasteatoda tepidariorum]